MRLVGTFFSFLAIIPPAELPSCLYSGKEWGSPLRFQQCEINSLNADTSRGWESEAVKGTA